MCVVRVGGWLSHRGQRSSSGPHFGQVALGGEAQAVDSVGPAVSPLAKLVRRLGKRHVGGDGAVDDGLHGHTTQKQYSFVTTQAELLKEEHNNVMMMIIIIAEVGGS